MVSLVHSVGLHCLDGYIVSVQTDVSDGLPGTELVGYLGSEVKEARERVRAAIKNSGFEMPRRRVTFNLAPANLRKSGTGFDLPMAVGVMIATGEISEESVKGGLFLGELGLAGELHPIRGMLPLLLKGVKEGYSRCYIPKDNLPEASLVCGMEIYSFETLAELIFHLKGLKPHPPVHGKLQIAGDISIDKENDLKYVHGQYMAKRGLEIAAAGMHNLIMVGPPGAGKTMLSKCLPSILSPLSVEECLEVSSVYSIAGMLGENRPMITKRPFISPHHTVTDITLSGGGNPPKAGLVALAHKGVLFLDEMPEFQRKALEVLRQPLEDGQINVARNLGSYVYPADFMLVGAMNPCPCGAYPDRNRCSCTLAQRKQYMSRLSKPLLDRMDLCLEVSNLSYEELIAASEEAEDSQTVRNRVILAQNIQGERFGCPRFNSQMSSEELKRYCTLSDRGRKIMESAFSKYRLSARSYHRILKVARTIADLDGGPDITEGHILEALRFRFGDYDYEETIDEKND